MHRKEELKRFERRLDFIILVLSLLCLYSLFGCTRTVYMPAQSTKKDSTVVNRVDSLNIVTKLQIIDSLRIKDSIVIIKNETGAVVGKESYHERDHYRSERDSTAYYKALADSLMAIEKEKEYVPYPVEKPLSKWDRRFITIGKVSTGGILTAGIGLVAYLIIRRRKRNCVDS